MGSNAEETSTFADRYQSVLVPVIFKPWANELINRAAPQDGEHILDLACGTGVVTREVANLDVHLGSQTAADHSADMLAVARKLAKQAAHNVKWVEADAGALPFDDCQFDLAFCQQALQFFPDRPAALRELKRVMKNGGRVAFCIQKSLSVNPMLKAQALALERHVGPEAGAAVRAICSLPDADEIQTLFEDAGFYDVVVEPVTLTVHHPDARVFAAGAMGGMHTGDKLSGLADERIQDAIEDFLVGLGEYYDGAAMRVAHISNVVSAIA